MQAVLKCFRYTFKTNMVGYLERDGETPSLSQRCHDASSRPSICIIEHGEAGRGFHVYFRRHNLSLSVIIFFLLLARTTTRVKPHASVLTPIQKETFASDRQSPLMGMTCGGGGDSNVLMCGGRKGGQVL